MWLHKVDIDHRAFVGARFGDGDWAHRRVMSLFPAGLADPARAGSARADGGVLFRVEASAGYVLIQSAVPLADGVTGVQTRSLDPLLEWLHEGGVVHVRCKLNAVRTVNRTVAVNGHDGQESARVLRRRERIQEEQWAEWAPTKLAGLSVVGDLRFARGSERAAGAPLHTVTVETVARIVDLSATYQAIVSGIGKGRSYGCGLLSIVPAA